MSEPTDTRRPWYRRAPWVLIVAAVIIVIIAALFAAFARGEAVDEVSMGAGTSQPVAYS